MGGRVVCMGTTSLSDCASPQGNPLIIRCDSVHIFSSPLYFCEMAVRVHGTTDSPALYLQFARWKGSPTADGEHKCRGRRTVGQSTLKRKGFKGLRALLSSIRRPQRSLLLCTSGRDGGSISTQRDWRAVVGLLYTELFQARRGFPGAKSSSLNPIRI